MLYACTCNLSLALKPHPPGRLAPGGAANGKASPSPAPPPTAPRPAYGGLAFDPSFRAAAYEDIDLCLRAVAPPHNLPLTFAPGAEVEHTFVTCPLGVAAQFRRYGRHEAAFAAKHPTYLGRLAYESVAVVWEGRAAAGPP
jgi:hypothetical protein